jgi:predicted GIY-YIG superfamily endonuclease
MENSLPRWYTYILRSPKREFVYVGSTNDLQRRIAEHNRGEVQRKARELEKYLKTGSGKAILKERILTDEVTQSGA